MALAAAGRRPLARDAGEVPEVPRRPSLRKRDRPQGRPRVWSWGLLQRALPAPAGLPCRRDGPSLADVGPLLALGSGAALLALVALLQPGLAPVLPGLLLAACLAALLLAASGLRAGKRALRGMAAVARAAASGDLERRIVHLPEPGAVGDLHRAVNALLDVTDAFVREAGGASAAAADGRFHRTVLLRGLQGAFQQAAEAINNAGAQLRTQEATRRAAARAEAERGLAEAAKAAYARRIAGLPALIYGGEIDAAGRFLLRHASDSAMRVIGWPAETLLGMPDRAALLEAEEHAGQPAFFRSVAASGEANREFRLRRADGGWIWVRDSMRVVDRLPDGGVEIIGYMADITEQRQMQARLQSAGRLTTLGEMATGLAHELNQPLAVMSLAADNAMRALRGRGAEALPSVSERLARIGSQAKRAREIVDHLRLFGRPDEGEPEPVDLAAAIEGATVLAHGALASAGIVLLVELVPRLPPVMARLVPLEQAIVNLLVNARDAIRETAPAEGATGRITIAARMQEEAVVMTVSDTGGGIPEPHLERLFEPFFTTKPPDRGTGLGLSLCHATMRSFGGGIAAANGPEGAVFTLRFRPATAAGMLDGVPRG
ncbi:sensor histidine kinase [Falsiroseomonas selenitidurans]|uniref:histidine kinase n=1 Tax=Falsiroseomonas selenitidurans TaxID=2716335 RepID=A0ABX1DX43_9PROT|nr:ATP-binding protein [Falsiroseomonas selenitidurans]NKC29489.1 PAS domain-containing protein [Falsiroseomonas selenitidurans]